MKIMFLFGHGKSTDGKFNDVGAASFDGVAERDMVRGNFYDSLQKYADQAEKKGHTIDFYLKNPYRDKYISNIPADYNIVEFHMDGNINPNVSGGHVIIHTGLGPDSEDIKLAAVIRLYFGWRKANADDGINGRSDLQNCNMAKAQNKTYRLLELGHITNRGNYAMMQTQYDALAKDILEVMTGEKLENEKILSEGPVYKVQAGAFKSEANAKERVAALIKAGFDAFYFPKTEE